MPTDGVVNVKDYGVVGNGTDESTNIQNAANDATGGSLYFPGGSGEVYVFEDVEIFAGTTVFMGKGATLKLKAIAQVLTGFSTSPLFNVMGANVTFTGLRVDGNKANQTPCAPGSSGCGYAECECYSNPTLGGAGSAFRAGIKADGYTNSGLGNLRVENCEFSNMFGDAISATNFDDLYVVGNRSNDSYRGLLEFGGGNGSTYGRNVVVAHNSVYNVERYNAFVLNSINGLVFDGNIINTVDRGTKIQSGRNVMVTNNSYINTNTSTFTSPGTPLGHAIALTSFQTTCGEVKVGGVNPDCGLRYVTISNNTFDRVGGAIFIQVQQGGVRGIVIDNNVMRWTRAEGLGSGVTISPTSVSYIPEDIDITNNKMLDIKYRGIDMGAGNNVRIIGNSMKGQVTMVDGVLTSTSSHGIAINVMDGLTSIDDLEISDNKLSQWSAVGGAITLFQRGDGGSVSYKNVQIKGNFVNQGVDGTALRMDVKNDGSASAASNYVTKTSVIDGNTFNGNVKVPQSNVTWGRNVVTGTSNDFTGIGNASSSSQALTAYASVTPGVINANSCYTTNVTVSGAADGDAVMTPAAKAVGAGVTGVIWYGYVSAADTVTLKVCNVTNANTASIAATKVKLQVLKNVN